MVIVIIFYRLELLEKLNDVVGTSLMNHCAVVEVKDLIPEHIKITDLKEPGRDHFHFMVKVDNGWFLYQNVGRRLSDQEIRPLNEYLKSIDSKSGAVSKGDMLQIGLPSQSWDAINGITATPGCRISPNVLQKGGDLYFLVEFHESAIPKASSLILDFVSNVEEIESNLIYYGKEQNGLSKLLSYYFSETDPLDNFLFVKTGWNFDSETVKIENEGVFQNNGTFIPKYFENNGRISMIAKLENSTVLGSASHITVDESERLYEFQFSSHFMKDFYENVVEQYSGPVFYRMKVEPGKLTNYYIVETSKKINFFKSLSRHWMMPHRGNHENIVEQVETLGTLMH